MNSRIHSGRVYAALILVATAWVMQGFVHSLLAAAITAIASWPLYERFSARMPRALRGAPAAGLFTALISVFALGPMAFAAWALVSEVRDALRDFAAAGAQGMAMPRWLADVPLLGTWASEHWQADVAHPTRLLEWAQRADTTVVVGWAQSMGHFAGRHALILLFSVLLLFFAYGQGEALARDVRRVLRGAVGGNAQRYVDVVVRATRASVASMLVVGLFDGVATGVALAIAGAPRAAVWGAIVGAAAAVPFLGYGAAAALAARLALEGQAALGLVCGTIGCVVLLAGDKVVRPAIAREGMRLPFVWVLMACIGGFEALGLVGLVVGPVVLALARELWDQRVRIAPALPEGSITTTRADRKAQTLAARKAGQFEPAGEAGDIKAEHVAMSAPSTTTRSARRADTRAAERPDR